MADQDANTPTNDSGEAKPKRTRRAASRPAGPPPEVTVEAPAKAAAPAAPSNAASDSDAKAPAKKTAKKAAKRPAKKAAAAKSSSDETVASPASLADAAPVEAGDADKPKRTRKAVPVAVFAAPVFEEPAPEAAARPSRTRKRAVAPKPDDANAEATTSGEGEETADGGEGGEGGDGARRRRRRGGRGRRRRSEGGESTEATEGDDADAEGEESEESSTESGDEDSDSTRRRRRRRRRGGDGEDGSPDDPPNTVVKVREPRAKRGSNTNASDDEAQSSRGSTRLEAKKQRRREGREAGRRRAPILTESEFLARREAVDRVMVVRQHGERTQIAVLEDDVLVEHYVTRGSSSSMVGNVYLGRVQNVLPSMEAAFVDIGRGRNAVLYAGEVNWDAAGLEGQPKRIELALKSGDPVLVQVTKDPVGQKGARLTSQISLPGRFLVYVPDGSMTGISRKLPDNERSRLKQILKRVMPEEAGVIVRTAAEGAPEEALENDVRRLAALWEDIDTKVKTANPPMLLNAEPDLATKVVRDIFNEDVNKLVINGEGAMETIEAYVGAVAPDLLPRLERWVGTQDVFTHYRVDEQIAKALDRKVYLPSGGSLVIDRTEAMTVVDVNTGKFTGQGGNLEQTVTKNNIEAAEEIVRQLRLRDIGGIIVVDFIDMVLESNRDLVLRRLVECLGRDRTKHQVAEVTSLGLVQMTRKRIGSGLLESFSTSCEHCNGRGVRVSMHTDDHHHESPIHRKPAGFVDPAEAAAKALGFDHPEEVLVAEPEIVEPETLESETLETDIVEIEAVEAVESAETSADHEGEAAPAGAV